jgi:hypothetical protein
LCATLGDKYQNQLSFVDTPCLPVSTCCLTVPTCVICATRVIATVSRAVPPVPFRAVSNALTMSCHAVPNFLKAGHDTVKTQTRNSTVPVPVPCLNPFRFQPYSYRSVPFPATRCLNLEHYAHLRVTSYPIEADLRTLSIAKWNI